MAFDAALTSPPQALRARVAPRTPPAVVLLLAIVAFGFVIYVPVALFRTTAPLLLLDLALAGALLLTLGATRSKRLVGGSTAVWVCLALYLLSLVPSLLIDRPEASTSTFQGLRSALFGVITFMVASAWLDTPRRAERFVRIMVVGGVFAGLYAIRQIVFGLLPFESERLALMGASAREIDVLERIRIPSSFGDPATFAFFAMLAICFYLLARRLDLLPPLIRRIPRVALLILLIGLGSTLTRAPMLGLGIAMAFLLLTSSRFGWRWLLTFAGIAVVAALAILAIDYLVTNNVLADSSYAWARTTHNVLSSVWTLVPGAVTGDVTAELEKLRGTSAMSRSAAWTEGIGFLLENPLGGGLGAMTEGAVDRITFSPIDVGILRFGLELGWLGMAAMAGLWASVFLAGLRHWRRARDARTCTLARGLLAAWLAVGVAQSITSYLHTELIAAVAWMIAAMIVNLDRIGNSELVRQAMQPPGANQ